jgi:excisionase family DNA binding protein
MKNRVSESENLLSVQQTAERLGVSYDHVCELIKLRKLRAIDLGNKSQHCYRIKPEWIDTLIAASEIAAPRRKVKLDNGNLRPSKFASVRSFS